MKRTNDKNSLSSSLQTEVKLIFVPLQRERKLLEFVIVVEANE